MRLLSVARFGYGMEHIERNAEGLRELALFAGAGGGILGGLLLGWRTVCAVEYNAYARSVLLARQNDGTFSTFPIWDDVRTFDGKPWRGRVDVVSGGFPCQDISTAGKRAGIEGNQSGLWSEMVRIIGEVRPEKVYLENSPELTHRGGARVIEDLTKLGYDCKWGIIGADALGLDHHRARFWMVANSKEINGEAWNMLGESLQQCQRQYRRRSCTEISPDWRTARQGSVSVSIFRDPAYGLAAEVGELEALGNGQVPRVAATAFTILAGRF